MPTDANFRFSTYLTLALCCVALGYAEYAIVPEAAAFAALAVVALGVLYFLESRVTFLSVPAANRLGGAMALVYLIWAAYRVKHELSAPEFSNMGWQTFIVALCGPLVMVAIVGKVARGDKHAGDYWTLHGVALAGLGLAAAFAEEPICFVLIGLYFAAAVWSLTLLHLGRASGAVPPVPGGRQPATKTIPVAADPTGPRADLLPAVAWAALALAAAAPLYLLTPRSDAPKAALGQPRVEIGYSADQMVNLNQSGSLQPNPEPAFEVRASHSDGGAKTDLNLNQRWRGTALRHYSRGEWRGTELGLPPVSYARGKWEPGAAQLLARDVGPWSPPDLGAGQFALSFDVPARLPPAPLADPVLWLPNEPPPVATTTDGGPRPWYPMPDGSFLDTVLQRGKPRRYVQAYWRAEPPDVSPPFRFADENFAAALASLVERPPPLVKEYADGVVDRLIAAGRLPQDCREEVTLLPKSEYHERVAREVSAYLAASPDFRYTTELRRGDRSLDPVEDFLTVTKSGHCERFAAALALMLRSQGIPAVYVLGFKGCEQAEPGRYVVRQEFAHTWVEALVPVPGEPAVPGQPLSRVYHWVTLDPTPGALEEDAADKPWWGRANHWLQAQFQEYVQNYTPEQRRKALASLVARVARWQTLAAGAAAILLAVAVRYALRRRGRTPAAPPTAPEGARFLAELLAALAAHGIAPAPGNTPREFAVAASEAIRGRGRHEVADVPPAWVEAYYQERFGGVPPPAARLAELKARLDALRRALAK
jgi:transglutaminase-like putative cysteine protease